MSPLGKVSLGWVLICILVAVNGGGLAGLGTLIGGVAVGLILAAGFEWLEQMDDE